MSFGMVFLLLNVIQITVVTAILLAMYWPLGVVVLLSIVPITLTVLHFQQSYTRLPAGRRTSLVTSHDRQQDHHTQRPVHRKQDRRHHRDLDDVEQARTPMPNDMKRRMVLRSFMIRDSS